MKKPKQLDLSERQDELGQDGPPPASKIYLDNYNREIPDPVPMEPPIGYVPTPPLVDMIRSMIQSEKLKAEALAAGYESFDEADDFDVDDDEPSSPYEDQGNPRVPMSDEEVEVARTKLREDIEAFEKAYPSKKAEKPEEKKSTSKKPQKAESKEIAETDE